VAHGSHSLQRVHQTTCKQHCWHVPGYGLLHLPCMCANGPAIGMHACMQLLSNNGMADGPSIAALHMQFWGSRWARVDTRHPSACICLENSLHQHRALQHASQPESGRCSRLLQDLLA
jgi:hypothetical protein